MATTIRCAACREVVSEAKSLPIGLVCASCIRRAAERQQLSVHKAGDAANSFALRRTLQSALRSAPTRLVE